MEAREKMIAAVRSYADAIHPGWKDVALNVKDADGEVIGYLLIQPDHVTELTPDELSQVLLSDQP